MNRPVRLGAVSYLNVRPLVYGLDASNEVSLRFDPPSICARLLAEGGIDLGMVPSITYLERPGDCVVPGVAIGSDGPVASVAIFSRRPMREVRSIALDTSSRTSSMLVRILCRRLFEITPTFVAHEPDLSSMLAVADAALLIGDPALFLDARAHEAEKWDLGALWAEMTGLPFVWAFWSGPADAADGQTVATLRSAARHGQRRLDEIAEAYCAGSPARIECARRYLHENMVYALDARAIEGLRTYYREADAFGVRGADRPIAFFDPAG